MGTETWMDIWEWAQSVKILVSHVNHQKVSITEEAQNNQLNKITLSVDRDLMPSSLCLDQPQCWQKSTLMKWPHSRSDTASATYH